MIKITQDDMKRFHEKLDDIQSGVNDLKVVTGKLEEHQRGINGTIVRVQKEVYKKNEDNEKRFKTAEGLIGENKSSIVFARGSIYALSFLSIILGILLATKQLNLW